MADLLTQSEVDEKLNKSNGWHLDSRGEIEKEFTFSDFVSALAFVNRVGELAEKMNHHPDLFLHSYKKVKLTLVTHSAKGLTHLDFELAQKIDEVVS